uniref:TLC domain-containing protein n=1 Tax=Chrysotila carterae TaxID=13221 RepID=A0A7S4BXH5_CHRCT
MLAGSAALSPPAVAWSEVHLFVSSLFAAGLPCYLKTPLMLRRDLREPSAVGAAAAAIDAFGLAVMVLLRLICYFPMAVPLVQRAFLELGTAAGWYFSLPLLVVAPAFNVASVLFFVPYVRQQVRAQLRRATHDQAAPLKLE